VGTGKREDRRQKRRFHHKGTKITQRATKKTENRDKDKNKTQKIETTKETKKYARARCPGLFFWCPALRPTIFLVPFVFSVFWSAF
jgi:hypothetical protein